MCRVPQGSVFGSVWFLLHVSNLAYMCPDSVLFYSDDSENLVLHESTQEAFARMQSIGHTHFRSAQIHNRCGYSVLQVCKGQ